jgi:hypothetical protein
MPTARTTAIKTVKTAKEPAQKRAKKIRPDDVWATINEIGKAHAETEAAIKETRKALKETRRIVGDLGNKFGDEAEYTLVPGLPEKFRQFGFDFDAINHNRKINNKAHNIHAELAAFLENGTQAMAATGGTRRRKELCP